jgi:hypothetical protein
MRETRIRCDRCDSTIRESGSVLATEAGALRDRLPSRLDLCEPCSERFVDWLQSGPRASQRPGMDNHQP